MPDRDSPNERFRRNWDRAFPHSPDEVPGEIVGAPHSPAQADQAQYGPVSLGTDNPHNTPPEDNCPNGGKPEPEKPRDWMTIGTVILAFTSVIGLGFTYYNATLTREAIDSSSDSSGQVIRQMRNQNRAGLIAALAARNGAAAAASGAAAAIVSADAAKNAARTAEKTMNVANRPWVKITHQIVTPLTFGFAGASGAAAVMEVQDTIENVGQTIALNVLSWEDVIPEDYVSPPGGGFAFPDDTSAIARQRQWCDANRNSDQSRKIGTVLFPHTPVVQISRMGPLMSRVNESMAHSPLKGKVSFVMVGCVCYRSSFEDPKLQNHQIRFMYRLTTPQANGTFFSFVAPEGIASQLQLMSAFDTFTAD